MSSFRHPSTSANQVPHPQTAFPFLRLPPELRNIVYRLLLISPLRDDEIGLFIDPGNGTYRWGTHTAILRTNHQVFAESSSIFYGENIFTVHGSDDSLWFADEGLPSRARNTYPWATHSFDAICQMQRWKFIIRLDPRVRAADEKLLAPPFHRLKRDIGYMCRLLAYCYRLREVIIELWRGQGESTEPAFATGTGVLEPFTTMRGAENVIIRGDLTDEYAEFLKQLMQAPKIPLPSRFDFMSLPLKVRKKIYRYLLVDKYYIEPFKRNYHTSVRRLCPNILATNKPIFREAGKIFFGENGILFDISGSATFRHDLMELYVARSLRRFTHFRISVGGGGNPGAEASAVNLACRVLVSVLHLDRLIISNSWTFLTNGFIVYSSDDDVLYPLQRLCNVGKVRIEGHISAEFCLYLRRKLEGPYPGHACSKSPHDAYPNLPWRFSDLILPKAIFSEVGYGLWEAPSRYPANERAPNTKAGCRRCNKLGSGMSESSIAYLTEFLKRGKL
ncbi:MAG: hypothetical protein M1836_006116 [Candelina mexicana]|nr:MAG: hypothetical protein M1836_006116 [Candelina mexicana]